MAGSGGGSSDDEAAAKPPRRTGSGSPSRARLGAERRGSSDGTTRRVNRILDIGEEPTSTLSLITLFGDIVEGHEKTMPDAKTTRGAVHFMWLVDELLGTTVTSSLTRHCCGL